MTQIKRVAQNTGKSKKVARKGLNSYQKSRKTMLRSLKRSGGWDKERKSKMRNWEWREIGTGQVYSYGGIKATSKANARKQIIERYGYKPRTRMEVWER